MAARGTPLYMGMSVHGPVVFKCMQYVYICVTAAYVTHTLHPTYIVHTIWHHHPQVHTYVHTPRIPHPRNVHGPAVWVLCGTTTVYTPWRPRIHTHVFRM